MPLSYKSQFRCWSKRLPVICSHSQCFGEPHNPQNLRLKRHSIKHTFIASATPGPCKNPWMTSGSDSLGHPPFPLASLIMRGRIPKRWVQCNTQNRTNIFYPYFFSVSHLSGPSAFSFQHCIAIPPPTTQPFIVVHLSRHFTSERSPAIKLHSNNSTEFSSCYNSLVFNRMPFWLLKWLFLNRTNHQYII